MDPAARAFADLEKNNATFARALDQNSSILDKAGQSLDYYRTKLDAAAVSAENLRRQQANMSTNTTVASTSNPTQITGQQLSNVNTKEYAAQFEAAAKAQDDQASSILRLRSAINPLESEQGKLGVEMANYKTLLQEGKITTTEYAQAQEMASKRLFDFGQNLHQVGAGGRVAANELTNLSFQINDVVSGLAMGQSPFRILTQQGGQIYQVFQSSKSSIADFGRAGVEWFTSVVTASRLAVGGIVALGAGVVLAATQWQSAQKDVERSVIGIGARTGTTVADINKFAAANASATGLSVDQARTAAIEFTKTGDITVGKLKGLGDAVHGYSILTGTNATDATKALAQALSGDLVRGAQDLDKTYGFLNPAIEDNIRKLQNQGERAKAVQVIIDAMAADNKKAADSVGFLGNAWEALGNTFSKVKNIVGAGIAGNTDEQIAKLKSQPETKTSTDRSVLAFFDSQKSDAGAAAFEKESNRIAIAADAAVKAIIPEIRQIEALDAALGALEQQRSRMQSDVAPVPGVAPATFDDKGAGLALANQRQSLVELEARAQSYNQRVAEISKSWGNVGQSTALALQAASNNLPVIEAIGGAAKMAAQSTADYKNAMDAGKSATDAAALAASNLAASQAQANAAAKETLFSLKNQAAAAAAVTGSEQISAQASATYNQLKHDGVDASIASAVASQQEANARARASAIVREQAHQIENQTEMMKVQGTAQEATTAAAQAYDTAIRSGADHLAASALYSATLANNLERARQAEQARINADIDKANLTTGGQVTADSFAQLDALNKASLINQGNPFNITADPTHPVSYRGGGTGKNLDTGQSIYVQLVKASDARTQAAKDAADALEAARVSAGAGAVADAALGSSGNIDSAISAVMNSGLNSSTSTLSTLFNLKNSNTGDKSAQLGNDQQFLKWLQGQPQTIENLQAITSLTSEMQSLKDSTDGLNSTMQDALSPYYNQDPRTSHIGFRSQGMATGGEVTVPGGYSANDNYMMMTPVAGGEVVSVRRPGDAAPDKKGWAGQTVNITQAFTINGNANKDEFGRTAYQGAQAAARQIRAATQ
jgi:hypothetical protein